MTIRDAGAAEKTRVEDADDSLAVKGTRRWRALGAIGDGASVEVRIELPAGSPVSGRVGMGASAAPGAWATCD